MKEKFKRKDDRKFSMWTENCLVTKIEWSYSSEIDGIYFDHTKTKKECIKEIDKTLIK